MRRVDGYLSRRAQSIWPGALVFEGPDGEWILERPGQEELGLGDSFNDAQQAIGALLRARRDRQS